jgi:thioredoxin 1
MEIKEYKDLLEINRLATEWLEDYKKNELNKKKSAKLKKQYKEMVKLKAKTDEIKEKTAGDFGDSTNWEELYKEIETKAKESPLFAVCFGNADDLLSGGGGEAKIGESETALAVTLKKMSSAWFGQFGEEVKDTNAIAFVTAVHDQAKKVMTAPKSVSENMVSIDFYGSDNKQSRKMKRTMGFISDEYAGVVNVNIVPVKDETKKMNELGLDNLPAIIFKRGKDDIATHEGVLSISALQTKVNVILEGGSISNSSSVPSIKEMKSVNKKELYSMGEFLLFYFDASWCGACKRTTPVVEDHAKKHSNVKFEMVTVDGSHSHHKSFGVTEVPSLVFVRDGVVIGKHVGYINPSTMDKKMELFAISKKRKLGLSRNENFSPLPTEEEERTENSEG